MTDSIAEIAAAPGGPQIGAFFDLDGTLVNGFTPAVHARHRIRHGQARPGEMLGILEAALRYRFGRMEFDRLLVRAAGYLRGSHLDELEELGLRLFDSRVRARLHPEVADVLRNHQKRGHTVVLSSSGMTMHVGPVARALGVAEVICNRFELDGDGRLTGGIVAPIIWGHRKAEAAQRFCVDRGVDLKHSYFYSDGDEDLALMRMVGHPRPVNPRRGMAAVAAELGWPVLRTGGPRRRRLGLNT